MDISESASINAWRVPADNVFRVDLFPTMKWNLRICRSFAIFSSGDIPNESLRGYLFMTSANFGLPLSAIRNHPKLHSNNGSWEMKTSVTSLTSALDEHVIYRRETYFKRRHNSTWITLGSDPHLPEIGFLLQWKPFNIKKWWKILFFHFMLNAWPFRYIRKSAWREC